MYPKIPLTLEKNTSYINFLTLFSKSLLIKQSLEHNKKICLIVDSDKNISQYEKHFELLHQSIQRVETESDLLELEKQESGFFIISNYVLYNEILPEKQRHYKSLLLELKQEYQINTIIEKLSTLGYKHSDFSIKGSYKKSGDIISITSFNGYYEYKISFWGNYIESIIQNTHFQSHIDTVSELEEICIGGSDGLFHVDNIDNKKTREKGDNILIHNIQKSGAFCILDQLDFSENYYETTSTLINYCSFDFVGNKESKKIVDSEINSTKIEKIEDFSEILKNSSNLIYIYTKNTNTIKNFIEYNDIKNIELHEAKGSFLKSFTIQKNKLYVFCDDIIGNLFIKKRIKNNLSTDLDLLLKIQTGDYVVHIDHGIGVFRGVIKKELPQSGNKQILIKEYIEIQYKGEDKLFVPITEVSRVNKYVGGENPKLTGLNTTEWQRKLKKVDESIQQLAEELLEIYSQRKMVKSFSFLPHVKKEADFQSSFPYQYTQDQADAIDDILKDMEGENPMDRLLVGDVGFGKTEVAFNAIYRSFVNKKQSILIAPLVVLAYEHYEKAIDRFRGLGMKIGLVTRMESAKSISTTLKGLADGEIDLVVGTHRLLNDKIVYKKLGLLVVDEEHKFGVKDKEAIKKLKSNVDILSMSATPIPRSLNMALSQIRQISIIKTPPTGRKDIKTLISKYNERIILDGCEAEFAKGGQVYFVHNRVQTLVHFQKVLNGLFPEKKVIITHGQLPGDTLEKRIIDFKNKKYDILLTTTVIENGIDFPNVNTIFINEAQNFGISQIHQLRGRVGRSDRQGYCYLLYKKENLGQETARRLQTLVNYSYLGAGFELAMKDLEIRGGGDLLGMRQSGQSSEIGVNLYLQLIEQKIAELSEQKQITTPGKEKDDRNTLNIKRKINTKIDLPLNIGIPSSYFESELDKINFYRELESINNEEDLDDVIRDFSENNSIEKIPDEMRLFFLLLRLKIQSAEYKIVHIKKIGINYQLDFDEKISIDELKLFLDLDLEVKFSVINVFRLRTPIKYFTNVENFLKYLLNLFERKIKKRKITLKK